MRKFIVSRDIGGNLIVCAEAGGRIAYFNAGAKGEELFGFFVAGLAKAGPDAPKLFDQDKGEYLVGDIGDLAA